MSGDCFAKAPTDSWTRTSPFEVAAPAARPLRQAGVRAKRVAAAGMFDILKSRGLL